MTVDAGPAVTDSTSVADAVAIMGRRTLALLGLVVFVVHVLSPSIQVSDSRLSVYAARQLVHDGSLDLATLPAPASDEFGPDAYDVVVEDGEVLPFFPYPPMLLLVPVVGTAELAGLDTTELLLDPAETAVLEIPAAALLIAATSVVMALLATVITDGSADHRRRAALVAAGLFAFGTAAWSTGSRAFWQHTPGMLCLTLALLVLVLAGRSERRSLVGAGAFLGLAFVMRPTLAVAAAVLGLWVLVEHRRRFAGLVVGAGAVLAGFVGLNLFFYGDVLAPYYDPFRLHSEAVIPFGESLAIHLVSPSRGLLVYTPVVALIPFALRRVPRRDRDRSLLLALAAVLPLHWLVIASYGSTAGAAYGSRFFTEMSPVIVVLLVPLISAVVHGAVAGPVRHVFVALASISVIMAGIGAIPRAAYCWSATPERVDRATDRVWDVDDPQFLRPFRDLADGEDLGQVLAGSCDD